MRATARASGAIRAVVLAVTVVFASVALVFGQGDDPVPVVLTEGEPSPQSFTATRFVEVLDQAATDSAKTAAAADVIDVYDTDAEATAAVLASIGDFFNNTRTQAEPIFIDDDPGIIIPSTTEPSTTTTTTLAEGEETTTTSSTTTTTVTTDAGDGEDTTTSSSTTTSSTTTTTTEPPRPAEFLQIQELRRLHPLLRTETVVAMVELLNDDFDRDEGEPALFGIVETEAVDIAEELLSSGIRSTELAEVRSALVSDPPTLALLRSLDARQLEEVEFAVADLVSVSLQANERFDSQATELAKQEARDAVSEETVDFLPGEEIVAVGERITAVQLLAIDQLDLLAPLTDSTPVRAMALIAFLVVLILTMYLWRIGSEYWRHPKMVALFGLLIVLAAFASRVPEVVARDRIELGFLLPAALFGYLAATLFDSRVAVVMALPVAAFTALATGDLALVVFAAAATLTPVPLVSSVSSRTQLNLAVVVAGLLHIPLVAGLAWFFYGTDTIVLSTVWGFVSGISTGVAALGVLPILSTLFGITTTQTLLDLTDRNHPALRLIEENAPGTFNHSVMVGNLADRAARTIGANPLLARAMAYYHDLGKTPAAKYYVENQFGVTNPHDRLPPEESAAIIRSHVAEGLRLAREYRIPPDVAQGILTHHGTSLMRFFYHKADELYDGEIDPSDYRHRGRKPTSKEMVILMLADATEASTRALVQSEDPSSESIRALVEQVIAEKVEDAQLEESDVTFGELTRIKEAFVEALIGYYHTRIPYPGFPGNSA